MLEKFKSNPVTTALGLAGSACLWLSQQTVLDQHPSAKQVLQVLAAGAVALIGGFAADAKAK